MKVWHICLSNHGIRRARAFADPVGIMQHITLFLRGWRPFNTYWWSKPSKRLTSMLKSGLVANIYEL